MAPRVTIHTPCFNRASTLHRVWESLRAQTTRDFEWIVSDDGSADDTLSLLETYRDNADFDVLVRSYPRRVGKPVLDNAAIRAARGEFFLAADSDDRFVPHAVASFLQAWEVIPTSDRPRFAGVVARTQSSDGQVAGPPFPSNPFDSSFLELFYVHRLRHEKWNFLRTQVLRQYPFPEVDYVVPEGVVWHAIGRSYRVRCINDVLRIFYLGGPHAVTGVPKMQYNRGRAELLGTALTLHLDQLRRRPSELLWCAMLYGRYSNHAGVPFREAVARLDSPAARMWCALLYPAARAFAWKDRRQGKVEELPYVPWPGQAEA